jgi:pyridinium-3,5-bisthiocarboxylic acid mononucleotide nickel chelatase
MAVAKSALKKTNMTAATATRMAIIIGAACPTCCGSLMAAVFRAAARAAAVFKRLAEAEAAVHGISVEAVHFHEVGAVDAIVDVVGSCLAMEQLGVEQVWCAPLPVGTGTIRCAHGILPNPAPATVRLLAGFPVVRLPVEAELTTPTAAAILTTLSAGDWTGRPWRFLKSGSGHGFAELAAGPNILRAHLAEALATPAVGTDTVAVLESDLDDESPEVIGALTAKLLAAGALDVGLLPVQMKKGRPGVRLSILARPEDGARLAALVLAESATIGVRTYPAQRWTLEREAVQVDTPWGAVRGKRVRRPDGSTETTPEFEACRDLAERAEIPLRRVLAAARRWE